ncbi:MAG: NAD(P)H-hydrate dehydratase [Candidatus Thermoplasmatota archaeon]
MMLTYKEVKVLDINSSYLGVPEAQLMENAGKAVAEYIIKNYKVPEGKKIKVLFLCGHGNNGGDGFVAVRYLLEKKEYDVSVFLAEDEENIKKDITRMNYLKVKHRVRINKEIGKLREMISSADLIVDALLGVGFEGKLREPYLSCVSAVKKSKKEVISVDVPSGLGTHDAILPKVTITFHDLKEGMDKANSGKVVVAPIGIPKNAEIYTGPGELVYIPEVKKDSHKGDNGRLLVVGGGPYTGAPALAAQASLNMGIDLVHIAAPSKISSIVSSYSMDFIVHPIEGDILNKKNIGEIDALKEKVDALAIGSGLGLANETKEAVRKILEKWDKPFVVDADGIKAIGEEKNFFKKIVGNGVVTPHANEFYELTGVKVPDKLEERIKIVKSYAKKLGMTILLKGEIDIISDGERVKLNETGNPGMTVGGTGDTLTGIVGGLLAKKVEPYNSARIAAFVNGVSGDLAFEELGYSLKATDIVRKIPVVLKKYLNWWSG